MVSGHCWHSRQPSEKQGKGWLHSPVLLALVVYGCLAPCTCQTWGATSECHSFFSNIPTSEGPQQPSAARALGWKDLFITWSYSSQASVQRVRCKGPLYLLVTSKRLSCFVTFFQAVNFFQNPTVENQEKKPWGSHRDEQTWESLLS